MNKKEKLTPEQRAEIYANSKFHERTWFRFVVFLVVNYASLYIVMLYQDILTNTIINLVVIGVLIYLAKGQSKTKLGYIVQLMFSIVIIITHIYSYIGFVIQTSQ